MISAIIKELNNRKKEVNEPIQTIYFGGGTPSTLAPLFINNILQTILTKFTISNNVEITLEANPEDLSEKNLKSFYNMGINRLSIGVQALNDEVLKWMNRNHSSYQAITSIKLANEIGFKNISADFIYGTPEKVKRKWKEELKHLIALPIQHVSAYHLTIEPKTFFGKQLKKGFLKPLTQESSNSEYTELVEALNEKNIIQYEVSNFALDGFQSNHNMSYWQQKTYLGIGPSAHSYSGTKRRWNKPNNTFYIKSINNNEVYFESEKLSSLDNFNELIMVGLRTKKGFNYQQALSFLNKKQKQTFNNQLDLLNSDLMIERTGNYICMNEDKLILAEYATRELFILNK
tara:strand:- start:11305 stop:12342 length:1038 start_codon:yes stop_codon:yes gene_type:complete